MVYRKNISKGKQEAQDHRLKQSLVFVVSLLAISLSLITFLRLTGIVGTPEEAKNTNAQVQSATTSVFVTPFFQFGADRNWFYIGNESSGSRYVYRKQTNGLVVASMAVYVNEQPQQKQATRVLPVSKAENSFELVANFVSEHCSGSVPNDQKQNPEAVFVVQNSVSMLCDHSSTGHTVVVGIENGATQLDLTRPNGELATYMVYFEDLRYDTDLEEFTEIINTFHIR